MKKILTFAALGCVFFSASAIDLNAYNMVGLSYDNTTVHSNYISFPDNKSTIGLNGFGFEYIHGFGITDLPMFIEAGAKLSFGFWSTTTGYINEDEAVEYTLRNNLVRLSIPVSYAYKFNIKDLFTITPYGGLDFRFNLGSTTSEKVKTTYEGDVELENYSISNFDKKLDMPYNRFQLGWHLGVRFEYSKFFAGLSYGTDFVYLAKEKATSHALEVPERLTTGNFALTLGYSF